MTQTDCHKNKRGFVLIAVAGVMLILGIVLLKTFPVSTDIQLKNVGKTGDKLIEIKRALLIYYETNGALPCPADPDVAMSLEEFGEADCSNSVDNDPVFEGGVPFKDLGLPSSYAFDDWKKRITYVMDDSYTGYESGGDNIDIEDSAGADIVGANTGWEIPQFMGVIISHGADGVGAYNQGRAAAAVQSVACGGNENCNGDTTFVKDIWSATNDDFLEFLTPCPGAVNGCSLWLDADDSVVDNISYDTAMNWADRSGNGFAARKTSASQRPTPTASAINGRRALRFDGGDLMNTTYDVLDVNDYSLFVVASPTAVNDHDVLGTGGVSSGHLLMKNHSDKFRGNMWRGGSNSLLISTSDASYTPTIYSHHSDSINTSIRRSGTLDATRTVVGTETSAERAIYVGSRSTSTTDAYEGDIGEVVVYDKPLTTEQRTRVQCEMARKWGTFPREGLQLWLDAQDVDGDGDSSVGDQPTNGDDVTTWVNKSDVGSAFNVESQNDPDMPARSISDPTYNDVGISGSFPSIEFDGSGNDFMTGAKDDRISGADNDESTIILIAEPEDSTDTLVSYSGNSRGAWAVNNKYYLNSSGGWSDLSMTSVGTTAQIRVMTYDQVTQKAYVDSTSQGTLSNTTAIGGSDPEDRFRVGRTGWDSASSTNQLDGDIGEILIYNRVLSDEEIRIAECYLAEKWDITINYPAP